jgi:hypothetical protein
MHSRYGREQPTATYRLSKAAGQAVHVYDWVVLGLGGLLGDVEVDRVTDDGRGQLLVVEHHRSGGLIRNIDPSPGKRATWTR